MRPYTNAARWKELPHWCCLGLVFIANIANAVFFFTYPTVDANTTSSTSTKYNLAAATTSTPTDPSLAPTGGASPALSPATVALSWLVIAMLVLLAVVLVASFGRAVSADFPHVAVAVSESSYALSRNELQFSNALFNPKGRPAAPAASSPTSSPASGDGDAVGRERRDSLANTTDSRLKALEAYARTGATLAVGKTRVGSAPDRTRAAVAPMRVSSSVLSRTATTAMPAST